MTIYKNYLVVLLVAALSIPMLLSSCNKDDNAKGRVSEQTQNASLNRESFFPTVENGTLKFSSKTDFESFLDYIDENIKTSPNLLTDLQTSLGYLSSNNSQNSDDPYFDKSYSAIMNQNFEYIVGDRIYVQKNLNEVYNIPLSLTSERQILRNLPLGSELTFSTQNRNIAVDGTGREVFTSPGSEECGCSMELRYINNKTVTVKLHCAGLNNGQNITMSWGDGTGSTLPYSSISPNLTFTHTYGTSPDVQGPNYTISYSGIFNCGSGNVTLSYARPISISENCCKKAFDIKGVKRVGDLELGWRYIVYNIAFRRRVLVNAQSFKYNGTTKFKNNANLEVTLDANYRSDLCVISETDHDDNQCSNCKEVQERAFASIAADWNKNGDIYFTYYLKADGNVITHSATPAFCN